MPHILGIRVWVGMATLGVACASAAMGLTLGRGAGGRLLAFPGDVSLPNHRELVSRYEANLGKNADYFLGKFNLLNREINGEVIGIIRSEFPHGSDIDPQNISRDNLRDYSTSIIRENCGNAGYMKTSKALEYCIER